MYFERYWTVVVCIIMIICLADLGRTIVPVNRRTPRPTVQLTTPYNFPHMLYNYRTLSETATSRIPSPNLQINRAQQNGSLSVWARAVSSLDEYTKRTAIRRSSANTRVALKFVLRLPSLPLTVWGVQATLQLDRGQNCYVSPEEGEKPEYVLTNTTRHIGNSLRAN